MKAMLYQFFGLSMASLNPCYNGIKMKGEDTGKKTVQGYVLILVIME